VRVELLDDGAIWRVVLATPKANVLDAAKVAVLNEIFDRARSDAGLKAVLIDADGPHFSFGASVEEHLPGRFVSMLTGFHGVFERMLDASMVTLAAVRGQCLGGGLELASFCHRLFAAPDAKLGQPEIVLGVFAPVASVALTRRVGGSRAEDLCLSGRSVGTDEALRIGLVDEVVENPGEAALEYARTHLLPRSAASLRHAARAIRGAFADDFRRQLRQVERIYTDELMATHDATEGLQAFLDKRPPVWSNS
jgi:cyclohexa-1,5-dienecarbonyl-CoA hydratase